ncbi:hypothetical protein RSOL_129340, partial [Rhizoctonia solani AG-3 Rhs1AP]
MHWLGLPSRPKAPIPPQISNTEVETYQAWFDSIKETQETVYGQIFSILKLVNRLDRGVPIIAQEELWRLANEKLRKIPMSIPQSTPSTSALQQWLASPWVASYLLAPHESGKTGSPTFFEDWQHRSRTGPLYHPLSKTFRGGRLGVAWLIRGLLKHLATVGAAAGVLKLPKDTPPGSDFTRLTLSDWDRGTTWLAAWHSLLEEACHSLESTVRERQKPAVTSSSEVDDRTSVEDGAPFDPKLDHIMGPTEDIDTYSSKPRASIPRKAKASPSYVDPYAELDEERSELAGSPSSSDAEGETSDNDDDKIPLERKLPTLLQAAKVKPGNYDERVCVFGPRPKAKAATPLDCGPEKIREGVDEYFQMTTVLFSTYQSMKFNHGLPYTTKLRDWIYEHTLSIEEPRRHLISTILLQRLTWRQAHVVWPNAESQYREFQDAFRRGSALLVAIQNAKNQGKTGPDMADIATREDELTAQVWTTRLMFNQFADFAILSTKYANKLRDRFLTIPLNAEYRELEQIVAVIRDWRQDYSVLTQDLRDTRKSIDELHQLDEYVPQVQNCWFWYGNPSGFVLNEKAADLVKTIPCSTEIAEESDEEKSCADKLQPEDRDRLQGIKPIPSAPSSIVDPVKESVGGSGAESNGSKVGATQDAPAEQTKNWFAECRLLDKVKNQGNSKVGSNNRVTKARHKVISWITQCDRE